LKYEKENMCTYCDKGGIWIAQASNQETQIV
jgi:hypothetical protein